MKRVIFVGLIGGAFGCILLIIVENPFIIIGYFGIYLISMIILFSVVFDKLHKGEMQNELKVFDKKHMHHQKLT